MNFTKKNDIILLSLVIIGLQLFLYVNPLPGGTLFWRTFQNVGHTPLFGITSICLLIILSRYFRHRFSSYIHLYIISFFLSLIIIGLTEIVQFFSPDRNADIVDFVRGILGSASFLLFYSLVDPSLKLNNTTRKTSIVAIISLSFFLLSVYPLITLSVDYFNKNRAFPTLLTFKEGWPFSFLNVRNAHLTLDSTPQYSGNDNNSVYATFLPDASASWPFIRLDEVVADWSNYSSINFTIISEARRPITMTVLIDTRKARADGRHAQRYSRKLVPGLNQITLPLSGNHPPDIVTIDVHHSKMKNIWLAFPSPRPPGNILIGEMTLR